MTRDQPVRCKVDMCPSKKIPDKNGVKASVILMTYQQENLVRESLESLINQDYPDLQIVVSDDASTDKTWDVIRQVEREVGARARLVLNRNETNLGIIGNYNRALSLCDGELIFSAAGDDVSEANRVRACVEFWHETDEVADLIATDLFDMTYNGEVVSVKSIDDLQAWDVGRWIKNRPYHAGASHMVTRRLLSIQPLNVKAKLEDQCLLFRALLMGGAQRLAQPLVRHRRGGVSNSSISKTYSTQRDNLLASAKQSIHEVDQYLSDAAKLGASVEVMAYLQKLHRKSEFIVSCLEAPSFTQRVELVLMFSDVPIRTRQRFFLFSCLRLIYIFLFNLKNFLK